MENLRKLTYPFRRVWQFCQTLRVWLPILWNDRGWDWAYLVIILEKKLRLMSNSMADGGISTVADRNAKELKICADLCQRILNDNYDALEREQHKRKYGESLMRSEPTNRPGFSRLILDYENAPEGSEGYLRARNESVSISRRAEKQQQADIDYLFSFMARKVRSWWD